MEYIFVMLLDEVIRLCAEAVILAKQGNIDEADSVLSIAAMGNGLIQIPLVAFGEAGRIACADAARTIIKEKIKRGLDPKVRIPKGFDLDDPYAEWRRKNGCPVVFLSHSHADKLFVKSLAKYLKGNGVNTWVDEAEINFGDSLIEKLRNAIDSVDLVIAILSNSSIESEWVRKELDIAMTKEIENKKIIVIPLLLDSLKLPGFLKGKFYADFSTPYKRRNNRSKLVNGIMKLKHELYNTKN